MPFTSRRRVDGRGACAAVGQRGFCCAGVVAGVCARGGSRRKTGRGGAGRGHFWLHLTDGRRQAGVDYEYFNENDGRVGKRQGTYGALRLEFALGYTFADNWWVAGAFFTAVNQSSHVASLPDVDRIGFDGLSNELMHRILERSSNDPFAVTLSVEPR